MSRYDVVCLGESMVVLTPDPPRPLVGAESLRRGVSGAESNVACYLARLGLGVGWVSRLGDDPFGGYLRAEFEAAGVDCALVATDPQAPTGIYFKDPGGGPVRYYRRGSAAAALDHSVWTDVALAGAAVVHLSGVTPALSPTCADLVEYGLRERPIPDAVMSFDVNFRPGLWPRWRAAPVLAALAARADLVFVGLDEAAVLWGCANADEVRQHLPEPATLVVKDGAVGATAFTIDGGVFVPTPSVNVVEPVGAGDAFAAGYLYGRARGVPEAARLLAGHRLAAAALASALDVGPVPPPEVLLAP